MRERFAVHRRWVYLCAAALTVLAGLSARFAPLGLPWVVMKYSGSALWAAMIYWVLALVRPKSRVRTLAAVAGAIAALAEFSRLWHVRWLDAFRLTLPGALLLGRYFSLRNIVAYWLGILAIAAFDGLVLRRLAVGRTARIKAAP